MSYQQSEYTPYPVSPGQSGLFHSQQPFMPPPPSYFMATLPSEVFQEEFNRVYEAFRSESEAFKVTYPRYRQTLFEAESALHRALMSRTPDAIDAFFQKIKPVTDKVALCEKSRPMLKTVEKIGAWLCLAGIATLIFGGAFGLMSVGFYMAVTGVVVSFIASRHDHLRLAPARIERFMGMMRDVCESLEPESVQPSAPQMYQQPPKSGYST